MRRCYSGVARAGMFLVAAAIVLDCAALVVDIIIGRRMISGIPRDEIGLEFSSTLADAANFALLGAFLVGGGAFLWWFYCAYSNLSGSRFGRTARFDPIWALIGWAVPGLNLVRPPQIMSDMTSHSWRVTPWWLFFVIGAVVQVALRFITPGTQQGWVNWQATALAANLVLLASLELVVRLITSAGDLD